MKALSIKGIIAAAMLAVLPMGFVSCNDDDTYDTNQYTGTVKLNVFGPCPVARGGELRFLGNGMNQITKIQIPGCDDITNINVVSPTEIRCEVPQTAEVGYITLTYAGGTITTKTMITYSEPISIESLSPSTVKPGEELTINGEYLNLMNQVCFSFIEGGDSVNVNKEDFIEHTRSAIKVIVPAEAVTGIVMVSDAAEIPNVVKSEDELIIVTPTVDEVLDLTDAIPGSSQTVKGQDFDLIKSVILTTDEISRASDDIELDFEYNADEGSITFVLPEEAFDGTIAGVLASGQKVALATIGVVVPTQLVANPATELRAGTEVTISGLNMDQVTYLTFPNVEEGVSPSKVTSTEVVVSFPAMAQSGDVVLNLKSGKSVSITLETAKPSEIGFSPAEVSAAAEFAIQGKNLDLVTAVTFAGDVNVDVTPASSTEIVLEAPATASSGELTLHMANGESVKTPSLTINAPECAYITECLTEEPMAGELMLFNIANGDKLNDVQVNGASVQYINNNGMLYVSIPESAGYGTVITLISTNGSISYTYDVTPATHVEKVIATGPWDLSWSGDDSVDSTVKIRLYKSVLDGVPAGAVLTFHVIPGEYAQIQINNANWSQIGWLEPALGDTEANFELTSDILNNILTTNDGWSETGLIIQGQNCVVSKITASWENEAGTVIYEGPCDMTWGDDGRFGLAMNYFESLKAGSTMTVYITQNSNWGQIQFNDGWWVNLNFPEFGTYLTTDVLGDKSITEYTMTFTQDVLDQIYAAPGDYWGLNENYHNGDTRVGMVIQGSDMRINKIVVTK